MNQKTSKKNLSRQPKNQKKNFFISLENLVLSIWFIWNQNGQHGTIKAIYWGLLWVIQHLNAGLSGA